MILRFARALTLAALCSCAAGCAASKVSFAFDDARSDPVPGETAEVVACPARVLVQIPPHSDVERVQTALAGFLRRNGTFQEVEWTSRRRRDVRDHDYDYLLELGVTLEGQGEGLNFLRCFPGFAFGVPSWAPLTWVCDLRVEGRLRRLASTAGASQPLPPVTRSDGLVMVYTSEGYSTAAYSGWWALLFTPSLAMPLGTGIVAAFDTVPVDVFEREFVRSRLFRRWAERVERDLARRLLEDMAAQPPAVTGAQPRRPAGKALPAAAPAPPPTPKPARPRLRGAS